MSGRQLLRGFMRHLDQLLAPGVCLGCGCDPGDRATLCESCRAELIAVKNPCQYCGEVNPLDGLICPACRLNPPVWQRLTAPLQYRGLTRDYLLQLKQAQALYLARCLCEQTLDAFATERTRPQLLLPVPLHRKRLLERGYNQASEIARIWSAELDIPIERRALTRVRATPMQAGLSKRQRSDNVRNAFRYRPRQEYRHVAIVDDIVTTGSTVAEITRLLHRSGVDYVEVWALARACKQD